MNAADGNRVEEVELLPALLLRDDQSGILQYAEVLHDAEAGHVEASSEGGEGLSVLAEERIEEAATGGVGEGLEDGVHGSI
jgi:hypothetical protein